MNFWTRWFTKPADNNICGLPLRSIQVNRHRFECTLPKNHDGQHIHESANAYAEWDVVGDAEIVTRARSTGNMTVHRG